MSRLHDISSEDTLKITQALREKHAAITYNRSDCRYLNEEQFADAPGTLRAISNTFPELAPFFAKADSSRQSRAFNESKTTAHTGIIPTQKSIDASLLTTNERRFIRRLLNNILCNFLKRRSLNQRWLSSVLESTHSD